MDCERLGSGQIPPVSGPSGTLRGVLAGEIVPVGGGFGTWENPYVYGFLQ